MIHAWPQPLAGDIVWYHFSQDMTATPADKPRPGLILLEVYSDHASHDTALLAYGTSQKVNQLYGGEFAITAQSGSAFIMVGLRFSQNIQPQATRKCYTGRCTVMLAVSSSSPILLHRPLSPRAGTQGKTS